MSETKYVTLYRYLYQNGVFKIDKFEYCKMIDDVYSGRRYHVYTGPNSYTLKFVVTTNKNEYYPSLYVVGKNNVMWSLSPDMKDKFLFAVREKKYSKLKQILEKADKYEKEIESIDDVLFPKPNEVY